MQFMIGFFFAMLIGFAAYQVHSLSLSGAISAVLVGTIIFGAGGWQWAFLLLAFFISSSLLSHAFKRQKTGLSEKYSKGSQRDAGQVFGNGGLATLFAGLHTFFPASPWFWLAFAASLAAVNADTWSTELGVLSRYPPRLITSLSRVVEKGTSGGVSLVGTLAALAGSGLIGIFAGLFSPFGMSWTAAFWVTAAGFLGAMVDSLLGATIQAIYYCPVCDKETERHPLHTCGTPTTRKRGWEWLNNDVVNLGCAIFAVLLISLVQ